MSAIKKGIATLLAASVIAVSGVASPYDSFQQNAETWQESVSDVSTEVNSALSFLEDSSLGRTLILAADYETTAIISSLSHEMAHYIPLRKYYPDAEIQFGDFMVYSNGAVMPKMLYPYFFNNIPHEDIARHMVSGLNQNEFDAFYSYKKNPFEINLSDAIGFLVSKFFDEVYFAADEIYHIRGTDISNYLDIVLGKLGNINLARETFMWQMIASDLLSGRSLESVNLLWNYILNGTTKMKSGFSISGLNVSWPLISFYQTPDGNLYNFSTILSHNNLISVALGNVLRIGGEFSDDKLRIKAGLDLDSRLQPNGYLIGVSYYGPIAFSFEYSRNDVLNNLVFDNPEIRASLNVEF